MKSILRSSYYSFLPASLRLFLSLFLVPCFLITASAQQCCDVPGWQWVVQIDIDNTYAGNTAHANYQVLLVIDTQTPIAAGKMDPNIGADIRFTDNTCGPFLPYWMESGFNSTATEIWVLVPSLPANTVTTLFMYYGNPVAPVMSSFNAVFTNIYTLNAAASLSGVQSYEWIDIQAGGNISIPSNQTLTLDARKIIMNGTINGNSMGYGPQAGPGAGGNGGGSVGGGGGGYGGAGGGGGNANGGAAYGTPGGPDFDKGSGGGGSDCGPTGPGAAAVKMMGAAVIEVNGSITMRGGNASNCCCGNSSEAAAGGAGGGIVLEAEYTRGTGTLDARGGRGGDSDTKEGGGGGGGGRVKYRYSQANTFSGTANVTGGANGNGGQGGMQPGNAGTNTPQLIPGFVYVYGPENPIRIVPTADFTTADVCLGDVVNFTDASTIALPATIVSYDWDFGDGTAHSALQNPSHTYAAANTYNVTLTVTSNETCVDTFTATVTVNPIPVADFTFVNQCFGVAVPFTDASTVAAPSLIAGWAWDFNNDMAPDDLTQNPSFSFPAAGNYTVGLGVQSDAGCTDVVTHQVTVYALPVANFTAAAVCEGVATSFVNTSTGNPNAWTWDFDDASPVDNNQNTNHTYAASGSYNVNLSVTTANGCSHDTTKVVDVNPIPFAAYSATDVCRTSPTVFTDNSSVSAPAAITDWDWDFQDNGSVDNTTQNPSFTYPNDGTFDVHLTVTSTGGCTDDTLVTVTVYPSATVDFTFTDVCLNVTTDFTDQSSITNGAIVGWSWDFDDFSAPDLNQNTTHTYSSDGTFSVTLTVMSNNGCSSSFSQDVTVYPLPNADFSVTSVCEGVATVFTDLSTVSSGTVSLWTWNFGDNTVSATQSPSHTYLAAGPYTAQLLVASAEGCLDSITKPVTVYPLPVVDFEAVPDAGCMPLNVQFNDLSTIATGNNVAWEWTIESAGTATTQNTTHTFPNAGLYDVTLTVTSDMGCETTLSQSNAVTVQPKPFPAFTFSPPITEILYPEITFTDLSSGNPTQWSWAFGNGDISDIQSPVYSYPDTGIYTVVLEIFNQYGCSDTVSHTVIITPSFTIYVPNSFSPNNDGINDIFLPKGIGWRDYELRVFSRSGNEVFSSFDPLLGWNGKVRSSPLFAIADVYVWRIYVRDNYNRIQDFKGIVTLVR